ncbi:trypsin-1-like [Bradysia coprophila]|uniref:trypsin-1-like n=1 Tax=Bradysia coprophila TaxID=38358 RepID=UPI00187DB85C|nr:trypsin-1-like [Bradysia coprophila]
MKSLVAIIACLLYVQCLPALNDNEISVIDGREVDITEVPFMLSLRRLGHHICGASVISEFWAITAAHCVIKSVPSQITLRGGSTNRFLGQLFRTERIVRHPNFNLNYEFDVAVIKTIEMLVLPNNFIQPIALGLQGTITEHESLLNVTGWGMTQSSDITLSENLRMATVRFINHAECNTTLSAFGGATVNNLCTIGTVATTTGDFCLGDEGGPLIEFDGLTQRVVGIASWSPECGNSWPSVFTRLTIASVRGFIFNITNL